MQNFEWNWSIESCEKNLVLPSQVFVKIFYVQTRDKMWKFVCVGECVTEKKSNFKCFLFCLIDYCPSKSSFMNLIPMIHRRLVVFRERSSRNFFFFSFEIFYHKVEAQEWEFDSYATRSLHRSFFPCDWEYNIEVGNLFILNTLTVRNYEFKIIIW